MHTTDLSHIYHRPGELFWKENDPFQEAVPCWQRRQVKAAAHKLFDACDYLRPRCVGDTLLGIEPNAEALASSLLTKLGVELIMSLSRN